MSSYVTLYTRVWIEIDIVANYIYRAQVTLYTRVWIEIKSPPSHK